MKLTNLLLAIAVGLPGAAAFADTMYVDGSISGNCNDYNAASRSCGNGSDPAFSTLSAGLAAVGPGDTLFLRQGNYGQLNILQSGLQSNPIVISGYQTESVEISGSSFVGLWVIGRNDVVIRNLSVRGVEGFGRLEDSTRITVDGVDFANAGASGTTGSLKFVRTTESTVINSSFDNGSDLLLLQDDSDRNRILFSDFGSAAHSLISIRCGSGNVIRGNIFDNPDQKAMEIFDCEGVSDAPVRLDDTVRNVVEYNGFLGTAAAGSDNDYNAIQHGGQRTIVRFNVFAENLGGGVNYQEYSDESLFVNRNRLFNNTFYNNRCGAIIGQSGPSNRFFDNKVRNNLLYRNTNCSGGGSQTSIQDSSSVILLSNSILTVDPGFVNAAGGEFMLQATSQEIDNGMFIAEATQDGSGTQLQVDDSGWFYDGFGIAGEQGDAVRIEGQSDTARIVAIDYESHTLTLDRALNWSAGDGVHTAFSGAAPDVGAFEFGQARPMPPSNLVVN